MEFPRPVEAVNKAVVMAKFVGERLLGGGWTGLPNTATREPKPPVRANITYLGENNG